MRSQFDGLRTILGNAGVAVPLVDATAVEEPPASAAPAEPPPAIAAAPDALTEAENPFADLPGLADLDRGIYKSDAKDASLRVDDDLFASANARSSQRPTGL